MGAVTGYAVPPYGSAPGSMAPVRSHAAAEQPSNIASSAQDSATPQPPSATQALSKRLFHYIGPVQASTLFLSGIGASLAFRWLVRGVHPTGKRNGQHPPKNPDPLADLSNKARQSEDQTAVYFTEGLPSVLMFALKNPGLVQERLKAYLGASALGYLLGSFTQGWQEVLVRKEETQIRADLLKNMVGTFRQSVQYKTALDAQLRENAKARITQILTECNVPYPQALLTPAPPAVINPEQWYRYPFEPVHFSTPLAPPQAYRFGNTPNNQPLPLVPQPTPWHQVAMKAGILGAGFVTGLLGQAMLGLTRAANKSGDGGGLAPLSQNAHSVFYRIFNVSNLEALFLTGNGRLLLTVLGLTGAAKAGKMLVDAYREIEVTRQNAYTEQRYQSYNWLALDPSFHRIAEEEALEDALKRLREAIPYEYRDRKALSHRIRTILSNIGRNSAPKYFQMTPPINLVAARG